MDRIVIIDEKNLNVLKSEIAEAVVQALKTINGPYGNNQPISEWIDVDEAKKILGYRSKTKLQELRDSGAIIFTKYGRKIKYNRQSLFDFLEKNKKSNINEYGKK